MWTNTSDKVILVKLRVYITNVVNFDKGQWHVGTLVWFFKLIHTRTHTQIHTSDQRCVSLPLWEPLTPQRRVRRCSAVILASSGFALIQLTGWDQGNWCHVWFCQLRGQVTKDSERQRERERNKRQTGFGSSEKFHLFFCSIYSPSAVIENLLPSCFPNVTFWLPLQCCADNHKYSFSQFLLQFGLDFSRFNHIPDIQKTQLLMLSLFN